MYIIGISAYYHDSAVCLLKDGELIAAAQEERFTRIKHDDRFPINALKYCLKEAKISISDVSNFAFYDKPFLKFERLLETYLSETPRGLKSFLKAIPVWMKDKLFLKSTIAKEISKEFNLKSKQIIDKILFTEHHQSHLSSAFFPSPYADSAILTIDGVGEWATTSLAFGKDNKIEILNEIHFPHSLGLLYSAFTYYTGFKVNSGEYKVMGLAPYGKPIYSDLIKKELIDIKDDGSFKLNMKYFDFAVGLKMTNDKFANLFGAKARESEGILTQREMDLARSIQDVTEEVMIKLAKFAKKETNSDNLCLAGGVALNCVGNGKILKDNIFKNIWIQPAAGDAGGAIGAAFSTWYEFYGNERNIDKSDKMKGSYLGPVFTTQDAELYLKKYNAVYHEINDKEKLLDITSDILIEEKVVGWHNGRMEFGPRALGGRSIIGDARSTKMQSIMNLKIKYRESFRPFAPSVLREEVNNWFDLDCDSPYMLLVAPVRHDKRKEMTKEQENLFGIEKLNIPRSEIPSVTHIDYSARIQTIHQETNPDYYNLINKFFEKTGCPVIVNTSFNVRGEPIVCTPEDSYKCFMRTEMDFLVIDNLIFYKEEQPNFEDKEKWQEEFKLD